MSSKEYLKSSVITFIATFSAAIVPFLGDMKLTKAAGIAAVMVAVRAGIKAVFQLLATIKATPVDDVIDLDS